MAMSGKKPEEAIFALSPHSEKFSEDFTIQYLLGTAYYQIKDYEKSKFLLVLFHPVTTEYGSNKNENIN